MKRRRYFGLALALGLSAGTVVGTGCYGSFALTRPGSSPIGSAIVEAAGSVRIAHEGRVYELRALDRRSFALIADGVTAGYAEVTNDGGINLVDVEHDGELRLTADEIAASHEAMHGPE